MEYIIIIVIALVVGFLVWYSLKNKAVKKEPINIISKPPAYTEFLSVMETVFKGGDKVAQNKFLEKEAVTIKRYSFWSDFVNKYKKIIRQYGK